MDLPEKIARLIDPELWDHDPQPCTYDDWHRGESIRAARRVIDGLDILRDYDPQEDL